MKETARAFSMRDGTTQMVISSLMAEIHAGVSKSRYIEEAHRRTE